jgi:hypothetical protein
MQGCNRSADLVAGIVQGGAVRSPHFNPGNNAINPRGLGTESPVLRGDKIAEQLA